jgi:putative SOS response-associated peptidase YedK
MPRGVLQGEPELLGLPPFQRRPGDPCLVMARNPVTGEAVPVAMRWGMARPNDLRRRTLALRVDQLGGKRTSRWSRCLVPVGGYLQAGVRRSRIRVTVSEEMSLAIAGIWTDDVGGPTFAIITTDANDLLAPAHQRMPVMLSPALWSMWLEERPLTPADLALVEKPVPPSWLQARATRDDGDQGAQLSVGQQLQQFAPGSALWNPRERGVANQNTPMAVPRAVG